MKMMSIAALLVAGLGFSQGYEHIFEEYNVVVYQLQVNVLDKSGEAVSGLSKGDFEVILDGRKQTIDSVEEIDVETLVAGENGEVPEQARRLFVFFFDMRFTTRPGLVRAQEAAVQFVEKEMLPGDLVGVFSYMLNRGVGMISNFTDDKNQLLKALSHLGFRNSKDVIQPGGSGYLVGSVLQDTLQSAGFNADGLLTTPTGVTGAPSATGNAQQYAAAEAVEDLVRQTRTMADKDYRRQVSDYLGAMEHFANGLRFIRGRKNLIMFSSGFDSASLTGVSSEQLAKNADMAGKGEYWTIDSTQMGSGEIQGGSAKLVEAFQESGTMIFALDTSQNDDDASKKSGLQALNMFSKDTGGRLYTNRNELTEPLREVKKITNHYYMVSFTPEWRKKSEEAAELKVKVKGSYKVYTNKALLRDANFSEMSPIEKEIQLAEYMARDQVVRGVPVFVGKVMTPTGGSLVKTNVAVTVLGDYFIGQKTERYFEIFAMAIDQNTDEVYDQSYFRFKADPTQMGKILSDNGLKYFSNLFVMPGDYKLKVVVRDLSNGKVGSFIEPISVPQLSELAMNGPLFVDSENWVLVKQPEEMERQTRPENLDFGYPAMMGNRPVMLKSSTELNSASPASFMYILNYRDSAANETVPSVQMMFMDSAGGYVRIPPDAISAETDLKKEAPYLTNLLVNVDMGKVGLTPGGKYKLMAYFGLPDGNALKNMVDVTVAE